MVKNNKKKIKEARIQIKNKEKIVDEKDICIGNEKKILLQKTIPWKIFDVLLSSSWAIFILIGIYLLYFCAIFYSETYYSTINQSYEVKNLNLWDFYVYNVHILYSLIGIIFSITIIGYYLSLGYLLTKNKFVLLLLIIFIFLLLTSSGAFKKSTKIDHYFAIVLIVSMSIWGLAILFIILSKDKEDTKSTALGAVIVNQFIIVSYSVAACIVISICILALLAEVFIYMGKEAGKDELNKRIYKSNTPMNIELKYFELEIPTAVCKDSSCIKFGAEELL